MAEEFENINVDEQQPVDDQTPKFNKEEIKEKAEEIKEEIKEKAEEAKEAAKDAFEKVKSEIDDFTDELDPEDVKKNKLMAVLAYLGILVIIPICCAKDSKFAKFHANQGLVLCIAEIICSIFVTTKIIGWIFSILDAVLVVFAIIGIVYALQGKAKELPLIGNIRILK